MGPKAGHANSMNTGIWEKTRLKPLEIQGCFLVAILPVRECGKISGK